MHGYKWPINSPRTRTCMWVCMRTWSFIARTVSASISCCLKSFAYFYQNTPCTRLHRLASRVRKNTIGR